MAERGQEEPPVQVKRPTEHHLLRFAKGVVGGDSRINQAHFTDDASGRSPLRWELRDFGELDRRVGDPAPEAPDDLNGLFCWRLSPGTAIALPKLDGLVVDVLGKACASLRVTVRRKVMNRSVRYRFALVAASHAHVGVLTFDGPKIEAALARGQVEE